LKNHAKKENAEQSKTGFMRDWESRHQNARVENAGLENASDKTTLISCYSRSVSETFLQLISV